MAIHIDLHAPYDSTELNAIAALIAALGGRAGPIAVALAKEATGELDVEDFYAPEDTPVVPKSLLDPTEPAAVVAPPPPPVTNTAPPASSGKVELDSEGLPWDQRIHAETKRQTKDGKWARRRNTDDTLWETVRAQLRQTMGANGTVPPPPPLPVDSPLVAPYAIAPVNEAEQAFGVPPTPPVAVIPPPPVPAVTESAVVAATTAGDDFTRILTKVVGMQTAGQITADQIHGICAQLGLPEGVRSLMNRPDLLPQFEMLIGG